MHRGFTCGNRAGRGRLFASAVVVAITVVAAAACGGGGSGTAGLVTTDFGGLGVVASVVVVGTDGRLVAAGAGGGELDGPFTSAIARYTADGQLDQSFSSDGKARLFGSDGAAHALAVQRDGKIVVADSGGGVPDPDVAVTRFTGRGLLDPSFGRHGTVSTDFSGRFTSWEFAGALAIQPDGKIVVAGWSVLSDWRGASPRTVGSSVIMLVRYQQDGSLDPSFGDAGRAGSGSKGGAANAVAIQRDGRIVVAGSRSVGAGSEFALARYTRDGHLDPGFGTDGTGLTAVGRGRGGRTFAFHVIGIQTGGRIVAGGAKTLACYEADGSLDAGFGTAGLVTGRFWIEALALQPDGKIVTVGSSDGTSALVRYTPDGRLDHTFGTGGTLLTRRGDRGFALAIQADGKIVVAGSSKGSFALWRYHPDGSLDRMFGGG